MNYLIYKKISRKVINRIFLIIIFFTVTSLFFQGCVQPESAVNSFEGNQSPVVKSVLVDPLFIKVGSTATISVDAEDPDGDVLGYSWSAPLGDIIGNGPNVRYSATYCCVGLNTVTVVVEDTRGAKVSETVNIEIVP